MLVAKTLAVQRAAVVMVVILESVVIVVAMTDVLVNSKLLHRVRPNFLFYRIYIDIMHISTQSI